MIAPAFKKGLTGFDSTIWIIKRYKKAKLSDFVNFVKKNLEDWDRALEFVGYYVTENNIFKDKLNPFLPETIVIQYRRKKKYEKEYGITEDDYYSLMKFFKFYTYHEIEELEERYNGYIKRTFKMYSKEEVKKINSETYKRFNEIQMENERKRLAQIQYEKEIDEKAEWIRWQKELDWLK